MLWIYVIYTPSFPVVGKYMGWSGCALSLFYAYFNAKYTPAYMEAAKNRVGPFSKRTLAFKGIAFGALGGLSFSALQGLGFVE
mmetsp:Transcript_68061/g.116966  ORF Transcript_68061/g.116966 Transcript_68061/m.116966 type:complete len:83 (+) Transcript_68061:180-428(+)